MTQQSHCWVYIHKNRSNNSITEAPVLPAKTLAEGCYKNMFSYNGNLTEGPVLPAKTLVKSCYERMFSDCRSINYIKAMFTTTPSPVYTLDFQNKYMIL